MQEITGNYPPVSSIWHYIVSVFSGYSEPNLYIGLCIVEFIYILPIFVKIKNNSKRYVVLFAFTVLNLPTILGGSISYNLLYVDLFLGILCTSALILEEYLIENKKNILCVYGILIIITLLKPSGFIYSATLLLIFYLKDIFEEKFDKKIYIKKLKKYIIPGIIVVSVYAFWIIYCSIVKDVKMGYFATVLPDSLKTDLKPKLEITFLINFCSSIINSFDDTLIYSYINIPAFAFIIFIFIVIYLIKRKRNIGAIKTVLPYLISYLIFFGLTALSLFIMFSYYEASTLASFSRYLAPIYIAFSLYILYNIDKLFKNRKHHILVFLILISIIGFSNLTWFLFDIQERKETSNTCIERKQAFSEVINKTKENDRIFIINQNDDESIMPLWYARYYCYPRIINSNSYAITWKIKTDSNKEDLKEWGLTAETFLDHIIEYNFDYVFLYSCNDELFDVLNEYFEDIELSKKSKLFKVERINENIKLIPID